MKSVLENPEQLNPYSQSTTLIAMVMLFIVLAICAYHKRNWIMEAYNNLCRQLAPKHPYFKDRYNGR